jgi:hypothetical protein
VRGGKENCVSLNVMEKRILLSFGSNPGYVANIRSDSSQLLQTHANTDRRAGIYIKGKKK